MEQKIVVHMRDGTIHKGITQEFDPTQTVFHVLPAEGGGVPVRVQFEGMKAIFWVRDYLGNRDFVARREFAETDDGRKAIVIFDDGEEIWGAVRNPSDSGAGFFFYPADSNDNNVRVFVIRSALKELRLVP